MKTNILTLLVAGSFFFFPAGRVKSGVTVNGIGVGGMRYTEAEALVRESLAVQPFTVISPAGELTPELTVKDNIAALLKSAKAGARLEAHAVRSWADAEGEMEALCMKNSKTAKDAEVCFSANGFSYTAEEKGLYCDYDEALREALAALHGGERSYTLSVKEYSPEVTVADLKERTRLISSFTTYFDGSNENRRKNIALACARISGTVVEAGGEFSFNGQVGRRTRENGFWEAAVILEGQFVQGVGGGVCQASSTLMNAALRAGLCVTESHPHSLAVGYVLPSLDAMVSEYSDLKFINPYPEPVYLLAETGKNSVTFRIYGRKDGNRYEVESNVLFRLSPPPAEVVEGEEDRVLRAEKEGLGSESFLVVYDKEGRLLYRNLLRRDTYAVVQGRVERKKTEEETPASGEEKGGNP